MEVDATPLPGSQAAIDLGCTCPILDNHYGRGAGIVDGLVVFVYTQGCKLHDIEYHSGGEPRIDEVRSDTPGEGRT